MIRIMLLPSLSLLLIGLNLSSASYAELVTESTKKVVMFSVRGSEALADRVCKESKSCVLGIANPKEFANGNSFIQISSQVSAKHVWVTLPEQLTPDSLMEALLTVYTARHLRAQSITVINPNGHNIATLSHEDHTIELDLELLFGVAGANVLRRLNPEYRTNLHRPVKHWPAETEPSPERSLIMGDDHPSLRDNLAKELGLKVVKNNLSYLRSDENLKDALVYYVHSSAQPVNWNLFKMLSEIRSLQNKGATVVLIAPYLPYARSDKADQPGVAVNGRHIADLIEAHGADSIGFVRAHAPQSEGFFSIPTFHAHGRKTINEYLKNINIDAVVAPDNGSGKEIALHAKELGVPAAVINKARSPLTQEIEIVGISYEADLKGKTVAVIDDETASGKTLAEAAHYLSTLGVKEIYVVVTSLTGLAGAVINDPEIKGVTVTDNVPVPKNLPAHVKVLSVAKELSEKLHPLHKAFFEHDHTQNCEGIFD